MTPGAVRRATRRFRRPSFSQSPADSRFFDYDRNQTIDAKHQEKAMVYVNREKSGECAAKR
jgi:hypothetical protein